MGQKSGGSEADLDEVYREVSLISSPTKAVLPGSPNRDVSTAHAPLQLYHIIDDKLSSIVNLPPSAELTEYTDRQIRYDMPTESRGGSQIDMPSFESRSLTTKGKDVIDKSGGVLLCFPWMPLNEESVVGIHEDKGIWCIDQVYMTFHLQ